MHSFLFVLLIENIPIEILKTKTSKKNTLLQLSELMMQEKTIIKDNTSFLTSYMFHFSYYACLYNVCIIFLF